MFRTLCFIGIIILVFEVFVAISNFLNSRPADTKDMPGLTLLFTLFMLGWQVYVFLCINSLYNKIEEERLPVAIVQPASPVVAYQPSESNSTAPQSQVQIYPQLSEKI